MKPWDHSECTQTESYQAKGKKKSDDDRKACLSCFVSGSRVCNSFVDLRIFGRAAGADSDLMIA